MSRSVVRFLSGAVVAVCSLFVASGAAAQGVTTGAISGTVRVAAGGTRGDARIVAVHVSSGTTYETRSRQDGRFTLPGMRVGGPYRVTATAIGFEAQTNDDVYVNLGGTTDLDFALREAAVQLGQVTVTAEGETVFSSGRTGAATSVTREVISTLPSLSRRIEDFARLTPQYGGNMTFAGQDNRMNNVTVDGSYFNNSFGLQGQPGDRTNVAPISIDAIEQVQISIAPYDVRMGNFVGAGVNTVTRSGTNEFRGSLYRQWRSDALTGKRAGNLPFNPGKFDFSNFGGWVSGRIIPNRLFFFFSYEDEETARPGTTFRANRGGETAAGSVTRVLESDLQTLSSYLKTNFDYETGGWQDYPFLIPGQRLLAKLDFNINTANKFTIRYNRLDSSSDILVSNSNSLGGSTSSANGRRSGTDALNFQASNYAQLEDIRSIVGELNSTFRSNLSNNLIVGYTTQNESRAAAGSLFPFVDIMSSGRVYTSFGTEPFTPNNELHYNTFQIQDNLTRHGAKHTLTLGASGEWYESENVFFSGAQSVYVYNSLADFYTDANGYLANPNRTTSPVQLALFQVRFMNVPGVDKPAQPLEVFYGGVYVQDEWRASDRLKFTIGSRVDVPYFGETGYANANADALTFRDENGEAVKYSTAKLPDPNLLFSPRIGFNWNARGDRTTQVRGGTGIFTGKPAYVWISNQVGTTGVLTGFESLSGTFTNRPFHPDPDRYKPTAAPTGAPAERYELALTDPGFKFPQLWRTDLGLDQRLPWGMTGTVEFLYGRDVNGVYYINANLPAAQSAFVGADNRPRYVGASCSSATVGPCSNRINNAAGNQVSNAIVLKNQNVGYSWNAAASLEKSFLGGLFAKAAYSHGVSKNTVDPGSIAFGSWNNNPHSGDPNNPGVAYSGNSPGHRFFLATSLRREYFRLGATTLGLFFENRSLGNTSYTFSGDLNGDGGSTNDLLYIPVDASEMNFQTYTQSASGVIPARTFTAAEQAAAWEAFIQQDEYLRSHRGEYVQRGALFLPYVTRADFSLTQELFVRDRGWRNGLQFRVDILNVGNLLNKDWGQGQRLVSGTPLIVPTSSQGGPADAAGRAQYRLRSVIEDGRHRLMYKSYEPSGGGGDVYRVQMGVRYTFN
ncbi:MAG: carboxypeptidase regulatory-like domain-containing protein [Gemmatimonadaceae bacterium]